jgi:hypothetical protein
MKTAKTIKRKAPRPLITLLKGFIKDFNKDIAGLELVLKRHTETYDRYVLAQNLSLKAEDYDDAKIFTKFIKNSKQRVDALESPIVSLKMMVRSFEADLRVLREAHNFLDRNNVNKQIKEGNFSNLQKILAYVRAISDIETKYKEYTE